MNQHVLPSRIMHVGRSSQKRRLMRSREHGAAGRTYVQQIARFEDLLSVALALPYQ